MPIREAAVDDPAVLRAGERRLLESTQNHFLRPAVSLVGGLGAVILTNERLILSESSRPSTHRALSDVSASTSDVPLNTIDRVTAGPASDEPRFELNVRRAGAPSEKVIVWFRDEGWWLGSPSRVAERDRWVEALEQTRLSGVDVATRVAGAARPAAVPPDLANIRKTLAQTFDVVRCIGSGGMGVVYEGRDRKLNRPVAIKRLRPDTRMNPRQRSRFLEEARLSAALHHPFIVDIYAILEDGAEIFLVFEYVDGRTFGQCLSQDGPFDAQRLRAPLQNVCAALSYAHSRSVVHRDVKPSNIMMTSHGYATVMDFGIARHAGDTDAPEATARRDTSGTGPYMAPEQERGHFDARADVFALGVTIYELLTGTLPFPGPDCSRQKTTEEWRPLRDLAPATPEALADAIETCLRADPSCRHRTIDDFKRAAELG